MKVLLSILLLCLPFAGTTQANLDSLWSVWNDASKPDTARLKAIYDFAWDGYLFTQPDSAFYFAQLQYDLAEKKGHKKHMGNALHVQGTASYFQIQYAQAVECFSQSIKLYEEIGNQKGIAKSLNNIGLVYKSKGEYKKAIEHYMQSLKINEEIGNQKGVASSFGNIGFIYNVQGAYEKALEYFAESLKLYEKFGDKQRVASSLNNIGLIYSVQGAYEKAIEYHIKSLRIEKEVGNQQGISRSLNNIGIIYSTQGAYEKALDYYTQCLKIDEEIDNQKGIASSLHNIGLVYKDQGDYAKALEYYIKSLKIDEEIDNQEGVARSLNNIGNTYYHQKDYTRALDYSNRALDIAQEIGAVIKTKEASKSLWEINKAMGRDKAALEMYELFIALSDSIASEENQKAVIRHEFKYEYEKQAAKDSVKNAEAQKVQDALLTAEKAENERKESQLKQGEIEKKQQDQRTWFLGGILALAVLFGAFIFNRFRIAKKQRDIIEEQKSVVEIQKKEVEQQKEKVDEAYDQLEEKNTEILDSINYAKRIQNAILPPDKLVKQYLENSFVLYKPKDIVAGDFYWCEPTENGVLFAAADCTGHGVPGALVSVVCNNGLNRSVREYGLTEPGQILDKTREIVISEFEKSEEEVKDGMDVALCSLQGNVLKYSGAHNPLWIIRKGAEEVEEIKAHKQPIGKYGEPTHYPTHTIELNEGDSFYIFSDGYADQFGGQRGKKFKTANFKRLLLSIQNETIEKQKELIDAAFENWKGSLEQLDDVCMIGVRV